MKRVVRLSLFISITILSYACSKEDADESAPAQMEGVNIELLVGKKWQMTSTIQEWIGDNGDSVKMDNTSLYPSYKRDDYLIFSADDTFEWNDNVELDPNEPINIYYGSWEFSPNDNSLMLDYTQPNKEPFSWAIGSLSKTELEISTVNGGVTTTTRYSVIP